SGAQPTTPRRYRPTGRWSPWPDEAGTVHTSGTHRRSEQRAGGVSAELVEKRVTGVEPATLCLASTRSSQLSYTRRASTLCSVSLLGGQPVPRVVSAARRKTTAPTRHPPPGSSVRSRRA